MVKTASTLAIQKKSTKKSLNQNNENHKAPTLIIDSAIIKLGF